MTSTHTTLQLPLHNSSCNCDRCDCSVAVVSSISICKACRMGAHRLRALRRARNDRGARPDRAA